MAVEGLDKKVLRLEETVELDIISINIRDNKIRALTKDLKIVRKENKKIKRYVDGVNLGKLKKMSILQFIKWRKK